jgi:hypothetical protein
MSYFENFGAGEVLDAADKFISKMDEGELSTAIAQSERTMASAVRQALVESILDAFRQRGESSDDVAEAAGTTVDVLNENGSTGINALLRYAMMNPGLLREATSLFIEEHPNFIDQLGPVVTNGITARLQRDT